MTRPPMLVLTAEASVSHVLDVHATAPLAQLPVVRDGWVVGMLGRGDVARFKRLRAELHL